MQKILFVVFVIVTRTVAKVCENNSSVELRNRSFNNILYKDGEYFVDNETGVERGCVCMKETCIRKCCPLGQGYDAKRKICIDISQKFDPPVWEEFAEKPGFHVLEKFYLLFFKMTCSKANNEYRILLSGVTDDFHLKTNGKLYVKESMDEPSIEYSADKFCLDNFVTDNTETTNTLVKLNALICYRPKVENNHYGVSASCMLISCFFIILTVAVYVILPRLRTLNGMVMITYLLNLFVAFLFMATMQILLLKDNISHVYCVGMTFIIYFSILAAFFWLNVMCYDLWSKLRSSQNMAHGFATSARLRFLSYSGYAFGLPTVLTIILAALEFSNLPVHIKLLPHLRRQGCFLYGRSKLLYLYTPIMFACMANLVFFILTARLLAHMKKQTQNVRKNKDSQRFSLYIKLFIVTGINWILEVISSLFPEANYFWQFTDAYNVLVGFIIFVIFVCKKKTLISLRRRYQMLTGKMVSRTETTNTRTSSCTLSHHSQDDSQFKSNVSMEPNLEHKRKRSIRLKDVSKSANAHVHSR